MKPLSTDDFLTLGMALTADKTMMERRVRGVFTRKRSTRAARISTLALCIALGLGCFTTACRPAQEATKAQPSAIPLETEEQAASAETAGITLTAQKTEREDVSFLSGLTEADSPDGPFPARIERAAVTIGDAIMLKFDADVIVPGTDGFGIARLERHVFADGEYRAFMDYLEPDADWRTDALDGKPFSFDAADHFYNAVTQGEGGYTSLFMAERDGRTLYYSKYDNVTRQSGFLYDRYTGVDADDFAGEWPMKVSDAQSIAEQMIIDLGIGNMVPVGSERAVSYDNGAEGMADLTPRTRGWMIYFAHAFNGLNLGNMNCALTIGDDADDPLDYQMSMWERMAVYVDETGIAQIDWEDALDITETVLHNVSVVSPELVADRLTQRLRKSYGNDENAGEAVFRVTAIRLNAAAIGEFPLPEAIMSANQGLMVPCWEAEIVVSDQSHQYTEVYVFNAVDGGTLVGKSYEGWPAS